MGAPQRAANSLAAPTCAASPRAARCVHAALDPARGALRCSHGCAAALRGAAGACGGFIPRMMPRGALVSEDAEGSTCAAAVASAQAGCAADSLCAGLLSFAPPSLEASVFSAPPALPAERARTHDAAWAEEGAPGKAVEVEHALTSCSSCLLSTVETDA